MAFAQYDAFLNDGSTWGREWRFVDPPSYGWARYITAVRFNQTALLARLIQKSTKEVNVVGLDGRSALHVAALSGDYVEVGRLLLDAGEDPSIRTRLGDDALVYAERYGRTRLASLLRDAMAKRLSTEAQPASSMPLRLSPRHLPPRVRMRRRYGSTTNTSRDALPRVDTFRNSTQRCCLHSCNGRGRCVQGQCVCYGNGTGFDCSEFAQRVPSSRCPHGRKHGVFIGTHGLEVSSVKLTLLRMAKDCTGQAVATVAPTINGIYATLDVFLLRLLNDPSVRAPSKECAQAVWHPTFGSRLYGNSDESLKWQVKAAMASRRSTADGDPIVQAGAQASLPWHAVMPHIHEEHQDMGSCGSPSGFMRPGDISLTHWGMADCIPSDTTMIVVPPGVRRSPKLKRTDSRWVAVDPELVSTAKRAYAPDRIHSPRVRQLFFRGSTREDKIPPEVASACLRLNRSTDDRRCIDGFYSLGIRQMVKALIGRHQMVSFNAVLPKPNGSYHHNLLTSEFCLTSPGMGFGVRIIDYVAAGCIPVVVRAGPLRMPLEPELDYSSFGLVVPFHDIPRLPHIIERMSIEEIRTKRERLRDVHKKFIWDEEYGEAYETVRDYLM